MNETPTAASAKPHPLDRLRAADPAAFAAATAQTAEAGAAMPRPADKEAPPAPIFRPAP